MRARRRVGRYTSPPWLNPPPNPDRARPASTRRAPASSSSSSSLAFGLPMPLLWAVGRLTGHGGVAVAVAGVLTAGFLSGLLDRASFGAPSRARLYLALWPFFIYWTAAMFFALLDAARARASPPSWAPRRTSSSRPRSA